jgi:hypothetical protein
MAMKRDPQNGPIAFTAIPEPTSRAAVPSELAFCGMGPCNDWDSIINALHGMRSLKDDWDGEDSKAPPQVLVDDVTSFACQRKQENTLAPDRIVATVNGTICFEWYVNGFFKEYEFIAPDALEIRAMRLTTV